MDACQDMKQKSWINAPIHIYELGGQCRQNSRTG